MIVIREDRLTFESNFSALCFLDFSVGVGAFVTGLSQISSFFSFGGIFLSRYEKIPCSLMIYIS